VDAVTPGTPGHAAAGAFVDDHDFAVLDDEMAVQLKDLLGHDDEGEKLLAPGRDLPVAAQGLRQRLDKPFALVSPVHRAAAFFVHGVVGLNLQLRAQLMGLADGVEHAGLVVGRAGNDQWRDGFIDQGAVSFVDDDRMQSSHDRGLG
jgi:hypothetical protein